MPVASTVRSQMMRLFRKKKDKNSCDSANKAATSCSVSTSINTATSRSTTGVTPSASKYSELSESATTNSEANFYRGNTSRSSKIFQSIRKRFSSKSKSGSKLKLNKDEDFTTPTTTPHKKHHHHHGHHNHSHNQQPHPNNSSSNTNYSSYNAKTWTGKVNIESTSKPRSHLLSSSSSIKKSKQILDSENSRSAGGGAGYNSSECSCRHELELEGYSGIEPGYISKSGYRPKSRSREFAVPIPMPNLIPDSSTSTPPVLLSPTEIVIQPPPLELGDVDCCCPLPPPPPTPGSSKPSSRRGSHTSGQGVVGCCADLEPVPPSPGAVGTGGAGFLEVFGPDQHNVLLHPNNGADNASAVSLQLNQVKRRTYDMAGNNGASSSNRHSELAVPGQTVASGGGGGAVSKHPHRMSYTGTSINEKKAAAERPMTTSTMGRPAAAHRNPTSAGGRRGGKVSERKYNH